MINLETTFAGLSLKNPLIVSSSPMSSDPDAVVAMEEAGAAAIVMRSIFEEQIREIESSMEASLAGDDSPAAMEYLMAGLASRFAPQGYLDTLADLRQRVSIPLIASINCVTSDSWVKYAKKIEMAGADAIELNLYHMPVNVEESSNEVEKRRLHLIQSVITQVSIPVTVKLSLHYTSLLSFAKSVEQAGAKGMVLFNRFLQTQADVEKESLFFSTNYSTPATLNTRLRWAAMLSNRINCDLAISGGIHSWEGLVKSLLAGATAGCICSVLYLRNEMSVIKEILTGMQEWMQTKNYHNIADFRCKLSTRETGGAHGIDRMQYVETAKKIQ